MSDRKSSHYEARDCLQVEKITCCTARVKCSVDQLSYCELQYRTSGKPHEINIINIRHNTSNPIVVNLAGLMDNQTYILRIICQHKHSIVTCPAYTFKTGE